MSLWFIAICVVWCVAVVVALACVMWPLPMDDPTPPRRHISSLKGPS